LALIFYPINLSYSGVADLKAKSPKIQRVLPRLFSEQRGFFFLAPVFRTP